MNDSVTGILLNFTEDFMNRINMQTKLTTLQLLKIDCPDLGLRETILAGSQVPFLDELTADELYSGRVFWFVTDRFRCHYILIPLMQEETPLLFLIGPYLQEVPGPEQIRELFHKENIPASLADLFSQYYSTLPRISGENVLEAFIQTLGVTIFRDSGPYTVRYYREEGSDELSYRDESRLADDNDTAALLKHRYDVEEKLMAAIARGDSQEAAKWGRDPVFGSLDRRFSNPMRDQKNYMIVLNTLCRKAAQRGGVHPIYLDDMSRRIAIQIENSVNVTQLQKLSGEMIRKYSMLVSSRSVAKYSPIIQKVLVYISVNLAKPELTLQEIAAHFAVNKSYLSALFKRETGQTLTEWICEKRIEHAIFLFNSQDISVQEAAALCGIPDAAYFARLFKRLKGKSPSQYVKEIRR